MNSPKRVPAVLGSGSPMITLARNGFTGACCVFGLTFRALGRYSFVAVIGEHHRQGSAPASLRF